MNATDIYLLGRLEPLADFLSVAGVLATLAACGALTYILAAHVAIRRDGAPPPPETRRLATLRLAAMSAVAALALFLVRSLVPHPREAAAMLVFPRADRPLGESADDGLRALAAEWLRDLVPDAEGGLK